MVPNGNKKRKLEQVSDSDSSSEEEKVQQESEAEEMEADNSSDIEKEQQEKENSESEEESATVEQEIANTSDSEEEQEVETKPQSSDSEEEQDQQESEEEQEEVEQEESAAESEQELEEVEEVRTEEPKKKKQKKEQQQEGDDVTEEEELGEEVRMHAVRRMLEPFAWEQLVEIVANAATKHDEFYTDLKTSVGSGVAHRKVYVHGLALTTKERKIRKAFKIFGKLENAYVTTDKESGKSRGFGFVTFAEVESAMRAIAKKSHVIDGCQVSCHLKRIRPDIQPGQGFPKQTQPKQQSQEDKRAKFAKFDEGTEDRRLFVARIGHLNEGTLQQEFKKFGELETVVVARDRVTKKSKGYAFVTYCEKAGADSALETPTKDIDGRSISCRLAFQGKKI